MSSIFFERPRGTNDYLMNDFLQKKSLEKKVLQVFSAWGYDWLETPLIEFEETIRQGLHKQEEEQLFRMFDHSGRTLALRPEMTTPVARVTATLLNEYALPLHLAYLEKTYRRVSAHGSESSEVTQAGIELIGDASPDADAEVLAIMASALHEVGSSHFRLVVGHTGYVGAFLKKLPESMALVLRQALLKKDAVAYEEVLLQFKNDLSDDMYLTLSSMPRIRGNKQAIQVAKKLAFEEEAQKACQDLEELTDALEAHGLADAVQFDFGLYLEHEYYTGILFEGYATSVGLPVCFGGRYDHLLERFGRAAPATGGVLHIERLLSILASGNQDSEGRYTMWTSLKYRSKAYTFAQFLRQKGFAVKVCRKAEGDPVNTPFSGWFAQGGFSTEDDVLSELYIEFERIQSEVENSC